MELSDLAVFRTVVRAGGVTRAARQLHRVQSNAILGCAVVGMGVALMPRSVLEGYAERGRPGLSRNPAWRRSSPPPRIPRLRT